jgi:hypothetical protein
LDAKISPAGQPSVLTPTHAPARQLSDCVQAIPSLHGEPSATVGFEHRPVCESQAPAWWHAFSASHTTGFPPVQLPD